MYKYDTLNSTFANQTRYWQTVPSKIELKMKIFENVIKS